MSALARIWPRRPWSLNPVLRRELLERWRGRRAFWVVTAYVGALTLVMLLLYWVAEEFLSQQARFGGAVFASGPTVGRFLFENLLAFVMLLVLFIAPGYAAAQVSGERERRTLALLQVTLVRPVDIVLGKLGASLAWLLLLVVAALPFGAAAFFLGGVNVSDLLRGLGMIVAVAVSVAAIALGISSTTRRTTASVVITYAVVLVLTLGTLFGALVESAVQRFDFDADQRPLSLYANPFYGLADGVRADPNFSGELPSVLTAFGAALPRDPAVFEQAPFGGGFDGPGPLPGAAVAADPGGRKLVWLRTLAIYLVLGTGALALATSRVRVGHGPRRRPDNGDDRVVDATPGGIAGGGAPPPPPPPATS